MKLLLGLMAASLVALSGCSENPVNPSTAAGDPAEEAGFDQESPLTLLAIDPSYGVPAGVQTYVVEIENVTPATGAGASQPFSPPVLATHNRSLRMFRVGRMASPELAQIAQDAVNGPMVSLLSSSGKTADVVEGGGVILPGQMASYEIHANVAMRRLSLAFMLVNTNDGFSGLDAVHLPRYGEVVYHAMAYDAGSEQNTELKSDIPGPCCGSPGMGTASHERIAHHAGIHGGGELDPAMYGWTEPVARITIRRVPRTYQIELENLTPATVAGGSQVFSPPILAMHGPFVRMFRVGSFATHELERIAEDGDTGPMKSLLESSRSVSAIVTGDGPIPPGAMAMYELEASGLFRRLSMAFMLVNTNDAFSGVDRLRLPEGGKVSYYLNTWDAGTELNTELAADIPGPCCGNPDHGPDEHQRIRAHAGILGTGDLEVGDYGWPEPSAKLTIIRIK